MVPAREPRGPLMVRCGDMVREVDRASHALPDAADDAPAIFPVADLATAPAATADLAIADPGPPLLPAPATSPPVLPPTVKTRTKTRYTTWRRRP